MNKVSITICEEVVASPYGTTRNTIVYVNRANRMFSSMYETNPNTGRGGISEASVLRAKRAQLALLKQYGTKSVEYIEIGECECCGQDTESEREERMEFEIEAEDEPQAKRLD